MTEPESRSDDFTVGGDASHLAPLIDEIEAILTSPAEFTPSTFENQLAPLLDRIKWCEDDELCERIERVERWCSQLGDASRAAYTRETIVKYLWEVEAWDEWRWESPIGEVDDKKKRVDEIARGLVELPIEWLKSRVTELRKSEKELHPPAYLTIHITFSLLPPLSTLCAHLLTYKVRFRVWDISQTFFSIVMSLKSFVTVPSLFSLPNHDNHPNEISPSEALALTVEAGLLLDRMIDISVEEKGPPIPDEWIDDFERIEQMVGRMTQDSIEPQTPCPQNIASSVFPMQAVDSSPEVSMKRDFTRSSLADSVFSMSPRSERLDDSMSSIEGDILQQTQVKDDSDAEDEGADGEGDEDGFNLEEALRQDDDEIFAKEYHAIATPPEAAAGNVDHSPFLERVIAELEELDPLESLRVNSTAEERSDGGEEIDEHENVDAQYSQEEQVNEHEVGLSKLEEEGDVDVDALFEAMVNEDDSEDEQCYPIENSMRAEIRTSSPIFDDHELHYEELESSDGEEFNSDDATTRFDRTIILDTIHDDQSSIQPLPSPTHNPFDSPPKHSTHSSTSDLDETITIPRPSSPRKYPILSRTPSPPPLPSTPPSLRDSHLHSKVTQIAHSHPTIALIPQSSTFRPTQSSEYGYYTLRPSTSHSRHSSVSSDVPEPRRVDMGGANLYVRVLSDRVMVRVGGGWVDLDQYLREYIGKREYRRRSGSAASSGAGDIGYELFEFEEYGGSMGSKKGTPTQGRAASALGVYPSPPRGSNGRVSAMDLRRSVTPGIDEGGSMTGSIGRSNGGPRRVFVRRK